MKVTFNIINPQKVRRAVITCIYTSTDSFFFRAQPAEIFAHTVGGCTGRRLLSKMISPVAVEPDRSPAGPLLLEDGDF